MQKGSFWLTDGLFAKRGRRLVIVKAAIGEAMKPLAIDLYAGLGGWTDGLLAEGYDVIGFDIERHQYGEHKYPGLLALQDVRTLHGSQFKHATLIVASPPCQAYSYRAMPWKRAKALPPPDNTLFNECFRIQREASEAAGHHIPLIVENVRGAQKWVGRARWNYGSFYLWGDVPALMPVSLGRRLKSKISCAPRLFSERVASTPEEAHALHYRLPADGSKNSGGSWFTVAHNTTSGKGQNPDGRKGIPHRTKGHRTNPAEHEGVKHHGSGEIWFDTGPAALSSKSNSRKAASAMIAKIPLPLSRWIGRVFLAQQIQS